MLKMKSRHVAGTFTKKKKSKLLLLSFTNNLNQKWRWVFHLGICESSLVDKNQKGSSLITYFFLNFYRCGVGGD